MAYDEYLDERIQRILEDKKVRFEPKKMMGGICYMVDDKMCCGIIKNDFMARVGEDASDKLKHKDGVRPMDFTGRPLRGYLYVEPEGIDSDADLEFWIQQCLDFNPLAKRSPKKKKKSS